VSILLLSFVLVSVVPPAFGQAQPRPKFDPATELLLASNDIFLSKRPYTVLVPKVAGHTGEFTFLVEDERLIAMTVTQSHDNAGKRVDLENEMLLSVGSSFNISCKYAVHRQRANVREFAISNDRDYFIDLNADGNWDVRGRKRVRTIYSLPIRNKWVKLDRTVFLNAIGNEKHKGTRA
jgi:hypothetical protein